MESWCRWICKFIQFANIFYRFPHVYSALVRTVRNLSFFIVEIWRAGKIIRDPIIYFRSMWHCFFFLFVCFFPWWSNGPQFTVAPYGIFRAVWSNGRKNVGASPTMREYTPPEQSPTPAGEWVELELCAGGAPATCGAVWATGNCQSRRGACAGQICIGAVWCGLPASTAVWVQCG